MPTRSQRARSVLTFFAQDTGTHNLVYANADLSKATQARGKPSRSAITGNRYPGSDPAMLIMDQKVATQEVLGELDERGVKFLTLRMRSRVAGANTSTAWPRRTSPQSPWTGPARTTSRKCTRTPR